MTAGEPEHLLHKGEATRRATFLELFFDLVYVFALTRITSRAVQGLTIDPGLDDPHVLLARAGKAVFLLLALWSVWHVTAWTTSRYDPYRGPIQLVVITGLVATMAMGVAIGDAFGDRGLIFATAYVAAQLSRLLILVIILRGQERQRLKVRMLITFSVTAIPWMAGALAPPGWDRGVLWALALGTEYATARAGWPVPGMGRSATSRWDLSGEHLAERYQQFFLIALGEAILVIGLAYSRGSLNAGRTYAFAAALATSLLIWRIYFYRAGQILAEAVSKSPHPARIGRSTADSHVIMLGGIVATAIGNELVINHPYGHGRLPWIALVLGGPTLFMAGRSRFEFEVFGRVSPSRIVVMIVLVVLFPMMIQTPPLAAQIASAGALGAAAVADWRRARGAPPEPAKPGL